MLNPGPTNDSKTHVQTILFEFWYIEVIFLIRNFLLSCLIFYKSVEPLEVLDPTIGQKTVVPLMVEKQVCVYVCVFKVHSP